MSLYDCRWYLVSFYCRFPSNMQLGSFAVLIVGTLLYWYLHISSHVPCFVFCCCCCCCHIISVFPEEEKEVVVKTSESRGLQTSWFICFIRSHCSRSHLPSVHAATSPTPQVWKRSFSGFLSNSFYAQTKRHIKTAWWNPSLCVWPSNSGETLRAVSVSPVKVNTLVSFWLSLSSLCDQRCSHLSQNLRVTQTRCPPCVLSL